MEVWTWWLLEKCVRASVSKQNKNKQRRPLSASAPAYLLSGALILAGIDVSCLSMVSISSYRSTGPLNPALRRFDTPTAAGVSATILGLF